MGKTIDLVEVARRVCFEHSATLDDVERWDTLDDYERAELRAEARRRLELQKQRQVREDVLTHGELARKHYAAMSTHARRALGVVRLLQEPKQSQSRTRARGAGRPKARASSARRSSERSGDSGEDGPSDEPPARRLCAFCGKDIPADRSPKATHCTNKHAARDRQRRKRQRDRERSKLPPSPMPADFWRMCEFAGPVAAWSVGPARPDWVYPASGRHSQSFRFPALGEYEALREAARARVARELVAA